MLTQCNLKETTVLLKTSFLTHCPERGEGSKWQERPECSRGERYDSLRIHDMKIPCYEQGAIEYSGQIKRCLVAGGEVRNGVIDDVSPFDSIPPLLEVGESYGTFLRLAHKHNSHLWI